MHCLWEEYLNQAIVTTMYEGQLATNKLILFIFSRYPEIRSINFPTKEFEYN